jgi:nucleoid-associated protein YgaU
MALADKYKDLLDYGKTLGIQGLAAAEQGGKLSIKGTSEYQLEKDLFWDKLKSYAGWEAEVAADIRATKSDVHGYHVVQAGDTLSKIAKRHLDDANRYMEIFNANKDVLKDPNKIFPGQRLLIPKR